MLEIQTKRMEPDIVVLEVIGRITGAGLQATGMDDREASARVSEEDRPRLNKGDANRQHWNRNHHDLGSAGEECRRRVTGRKCQRACRTSIEDDERG